MTRMFLSTLVIYAISTAAVAQPASPASNHGKESADPLSVCELNENRDGWDTKVLWLLGRVVSIKNKHSSRRPYVIVEVKDVAGDCDMRLYFRYKQNFLSVNSQPLILGRYFKAYRYFQWTFKNEVQPTEFMIAPCTWFLTQNGWSVCGGKGPAP